MKKTALLIAALLITIVGLITFYLTSSDEVISAEQKQTEAMLSATQLKFGEIRMNTKAESEITIENTGEYPLIIYDIETSCGCTEVEWNKKPIKKGDFGRIKITYQDKYPGPFMKTITVYGNISTPLTCKIIGSVME